jgi:hypothetical protein
VFDVLTDHRGHAKMTALRSSTLEHEGEPAPNGVGAIRVLHLIGPPIRERVTTFDRPRQAPAHTRPHTGLPHCAPSPPLARFSV